VLEKIPRDLAKRVSQALNIPTIGIGAGPDVDGQVLVLHDLLGITMDFSPRFLRRYLNLSESIDGALKQYCDDVRSGDFPSDEESYTS
jgi:3-methyl-2-oxobutanoate hydroxymethyltransferase